MSRRGSARPSSLASHDLVEARECYRGGYVATCACRAQFRGRTEEGVRTLHAQHAIDDPRRARAAEDARRCPTPAKKRYPSKESAVRDLPRRWATQPWGSSNLTPYECQCGKWHLTSDRRNWEARYES